MGKDLRPMRRSGHIVSETYGEQVARIEVTIAVVGLYVVEHISDYAAVLSNFVQSVGPGVTHLRTQPTPGAYSEVRLQRIVVRRSNAVQLNDGAIVLGRADIERPVLVYVGNNVQFASLASHITDLEHARLSYTLLHLEVVVVEVGRAEVLAHAE